MKQPFDSCCGNPARCGSTACDEYQVEEIMDQQREQDPHGWMVRQAVERYVALTPGLGEAYLRDPQQHAMIHILKRTLSKVDQAMEDEGVAIEVRQRVISTAVFGGPDEEAALARAAQAQAQMSQSFLPRDLPKD